MKKKNTQTTILITASDYARRHKVSRVAVNQYIKADKVRAVRIGGVWLIEDKLTIK